MVIESITKLFVPAAETITGYIKHYFILTTITNEQIS
jgi:hypothetical protein